MHIFFFNDTATTEIYTLSLHDALPILEKARMEQEMRIAAEIQQALLPKASRTGSYFRAAAASLPDRKSTRLNSSHSQISYAVFCLKKKKKKKECPTIRHLDNHPHYNNK